MKTVTMGEIMLRLAPEGYLRFVQADRLEATYGGGEANVAVSLSMLGEEASFVTKLPSHEIGQCAVNALRRYGVNTDDIVRGGDRIGIYFLEKGASQRGSKVVYDRAGSSFASSKAEEYDFDKIFEGADWFHITGITPALGENGREIALEACRRAKEKGLTVSCDLNYRKKLWTKEEANAFMTTLMPYVDVCIANEEDAADVFGIYAKNTDIEKGEIKKPSYVSVAQQLMERFGFKYVAITLRSSYSASDNGWAGLLYDGEAHFSKEYDVHIVDRVGGGDSFTAGLIYAMKHGYDAEKAVEFAVAASCLKHSVEGDFNMVSFAEVQALAAGNASGRVQR